MEARARTRKNGASGHAAPAEGFDAAADIVAAYERYVAAASLPTAYDRYAAGLYDVVRGLVDDDKKAHRIVRAAFVAARQTFAQSAEPLRQAPKPPPAAAPATGGTCPQLGYADDPGNHYSRPTQMHRCYATGAGAQVTRQEQNRFCLSSSFGGCPRLVGPALLPMRGNDATEPAPERAPLEPVRVPPPADPAPATVSTELVRFLLPAPVPSAGPEDNGPALPASLVALAIRKPGRPTPLEAAVTRRLRAVADPFDEPTLDDTVLPLVEAPHEGLLATAQRSVLAVAALSVAVAVAIGVALVLRPWDDTFGLLTDQELLQISSAAENRAALAVASQESAAAGQAAIPALSVPGVAGAQAASAPYLFDPPEVPAKPDAEVAVAPVPVQPGLAVARKTTRAPAGFPGANLREGPSTSARSLIMLQNGTPVDVLPDTASGDGFTWVHARTANGVEGWIVETAVEA